jgi:hypothetical protein
MGQDLTYQSDDARYECRISRADSELIESLRGHLPIEIEALFLVPSLGEPVRVSTSILRSAVDAVIAFIAGNKDVLPYTYQFKAETPPDPRMTPGFSTGGMSGIRLPGDNDRSYTIRAGLNECRLEKLAVGPDGRPDYELERDLRGERELLTSNLGRIAIRRTRAKADLVKALPQIQRFLRSISTADVTKCVG